MTPQAIIDMVKELAVLGASPAVQQAALVRLAQVNGHSIAELQKMAAEQIPAWQPPEPA